MAGKECSSTMNQKAKPVIQINTGTGKFTEALVSSMRNYPIFLGMPYLNHYQVVINCGNATIRFPKTGYML
jgi:hypothetical protein